MSIHRGWVGVGFWACIALVACGKGTLNPANGQADDAARRAGIESEIAAAGTLPTVEATPAKFTYQSDTVYSLDQLIFNLGADAKWATTDIQGKLGFSTDKEYNRVMVKLSQEYFTMAFDSPGSASNFFDPSVKPEDLT